MDFSKQNIKMCEKAFEIQRLWKPKKGDFFIDLRVADSVNPVCYCYYCFSDEEEPNSEFCTWIPRQDDLQGMINEQESLWKKLDYFYSNIGDFYKENFDDYYKNFLSFEQLWLAFVMKEKFNKIWNGTEWQRQRTGKS